MDQILSWEKIKALITARFPFWFVGNPNRTGRPFYCNNGDRFNETVSLQGTYLPQGDYYYAPSLSELIEACGDFFGELNKFNDGSYLASGPEKKGLLYYSLFMGGRSAEEAVANLYILIKERGLDPARPLSDQLHAEPPLAESLLSVPVDRKFVLQQIRKRRTPGNSELIDAILKDVCGMDYNSTVSAPDHGFCPGETDAPAKLHLLPGGKP